MKAEKMYSLEETADNRDAQPEAGRTTIFRHPDLFIAISVVILFATIFLGGNFWWPVFVAAILVAGLGYTCVRNARSPAS